MKSKNGHRYPIDDDYTVSECVINAVADVKGEDPGVLSPPLYTTIDPDALDSLIASMTTGHVNFEYANHHVTVTSDEIIVVVADE